MWIGCRLGGCQNVASNECMICACVEPKVASLGLAIWKTTNTEQNKRKSRAMNHRDNIPNKTSMEIPTAKSGAVG